MHIITPQARKAKDMAVEINSKVASVKHSEVCKYLHYDEETGDFFWKLDKGSAAKAGNKAGKINPRSGYWFISLNKVSMSAHRLAWFYCYKEWPELQIDHINGIRTDNRISNLRQCTHKQNMQNVYRKKLDSEISSEFAGVHWDKKRGKWCAIIGADSRRTFLGHFHNERKAFMAYLIAKKVLHDMQKTVRGFDKNGFDDTAVEKFIETGEIP